MARLLALETFAVPPPAGHSATVGQTELEDARLAAYEQGYAAGWDDAVAAETADVARLRADLGRNLTEMALTYRDARRHVLTALEPLLQEMVAKVLPAVAQQSLGRIILDELRPIAENLSSAPVVVRIAPCNRAAVEELLAASTELPLRVAEEPALGDGQAYLKVGQTEISVDLDGVVTAITSAVTTFFAIETPEDTP
jgi:flagellar biosynthesis/type III secretory pathway protein FliH